MSRRQIKSRFCHKLHKEMRPEHAKICATYDKNDGVLSARIAPNFHRKHLTPLSHLCTKKIEGDQLPSGNEEHKALGR